MALSNRLLNRAHARQTAMKPYTMADIAAACKVSKATVSRVMNGKAEGVGDETRRRVQKAIKQFNYRPNTIARSIATSKSPTVGLIIPDASNLFYPVIIKGVCDALERRGYHMILANSGSDPKKEAELLVSMVDMRVEGVILCSGVSNTRFLADYKKYNTPLVAIGRSTDIDYSDASISGNNFTGAQIATRYLIEGGNPHIVYIDGHPEYSGVMQKREGFLAAMREAGREVGADAIFTGEHSYEHGFQVASLLLEQNRPVSAIFAGSDLIAAGVVQALTSRGVRIPDDVEVIGFDNIILSEMVEPRLTTMHKPHEDMAARAVDMLFEVVNGSIGELRHITVDPRLLVRGTTRPR